MSINAKSTKDQILKAYNALEKEKKEVEVKLRQAERDLTQTQKDAEACKAKMEALKQSTGIQPIIKVVGDAAKVNTVEGILLTLESIEQGLGTSINEISAKLTLEADGLAELLKQTQEKTEVLQSLYTIEVSDGMLDKLLDEYEQTEENFAEEIKKQRLTAEEGYLELLKNWHKEQQKHEKLWQETLDATAKNQKREYQEYQYDLEHARNAERDNYDQKKKQLQIDLDEIRETKVNEWNEREKQLKNREDEFAKYKTEFEQLPDKTDKEVKKAEAEGKAIIEKDAKVKADLLTKEHDSQKRMYELRIQTLQTLIESRKTQIESLNRQVEAAHKQAQDLAIKAIEGTANLDKFNAVKEIANELAKNQPKTK
ncbi:MAG: hypothetical protein MUE85_22760 [Microscillaceae bacterium]|jgi:hypothetical protein|nr:hypothetical protein [Microscillaceae bacterium]